MDRPCVICHGSGYDEHVDVSLPAPPCRLCYPEEAQRHMMLARDTRQVAAVRRKAAYEMLRDAVSAGASGRV